MSERLPDPWRPGLRSILMANIQTLRSVNTPQNLATVTLLIEDMKVLDKEENWFRRKVREAIKIHKRKPALNRDCDCSRPSSSNF